MLNPKESAILSMISRVPSSGKRADTRTYPGKNSKKGRPKTVLKTLSGNSITANNSRVVKIATITSTYDYLNTL